MASRAFSSRSSTLPLTIDVSTAAGGATAAPLAGALWGESVGATDAVGAAAAAAPGCAFSFDSDQKAPAARATTAKPTPPPTIHFRLGSALACVATGRGRKASTVTPAREAGWPRPVGFFATARAIAISRTALARSEEHTSELQSRLHLVCRLLLEKKN